MELGKHLCGLTKQLWHYYLLNPTEDNFGKIVESWAKDLSMIGTGKHEVYNSAAAAVNDLAGNQKKAALVRFDLLDEWYEAMMIREDVGIVYGGIWVREHVEEGTEALIEMDTRFTLVYALDEEGEWKIVHIHHSMPYFDQGESEYYPKALSAKVREALDLVEMFKRRSEIDQMTGVYNHESFQRHAELKMAREKQLCFFIVDLDDFKAVNDTYGHGTGDTLLKFLAKVLRKYFSHDASVGRLGGDEFAVCQSCPGGRAEIEELLGTMRAEYQSGSRELLNGKSASYSIGIAEWENGAVTYRQLYAKADEALYQAKKLGKDRMYLLQVPKEEEAGN